MTRKHQPGDCVCCCPKCKSYYYNQAGYTIDDEWTVDSGTWQGVPAGLVEGKDNNAAIFMSDDIPYDCYALSTSFNMRTRKEETDWSNVGKPSVLDKARIYFFYKDANNHAYVQLDSVSNSSTSGSSTCSGTTVWEQTGNFKIVKVIGGTATTLYSVSALGIYSSESEIFGTIGVPLNMRWCGNTLHIMVWKQGTNVLGVNNEPCACPIKEEDWRTFTFTDTEIAALGSKIGFETGSSSVEEGWIQEYAKAYPFTVYERCDNCGDCECHLCYEGTVPDQIEVTFYNVGTGDCTCSALNGTTYVLDKRYNSGNWSGCNWIYEDLSDDTTSCTDAYPPEKTRILVRLSGGAGLPCVDTGITYLDVFIMGYHQTYGLGGVGTGCYKWKIEGSGSAILNNVSPTIMKHGNVLCDQIDDVRVDLAKTADDPTPECNYDNSYVLVSSA